MQYARHENQFHRMILGSFRAMMPGRASIGRATSRDALLSARGAMLAEQQWQAAVIYFGRCFAAHEYETRSAKCDESATAAFNSTPFMTIDAAPTGRKPLAA